MEHSGNGSRRTIVAFVRTVCRPVPTLCVNRTNQPRRHRGVPQAESKGRAAGSSLFTLLSELIF
jgi:hypothetical protein